MKKVPLYSRSSRSVTPPSDASAEASERAAPAGAAASAEPASPPPAGRTRGWVDRYERRFWVAALVLALGTFWWLDPARRIGPTYTMEQVDAAMRTSLEEKPLVSQASRAFDAVIPSVVRVIGLMTDGDDGSEEASKNGSVERGVGSGVVIIDNGTILTNLHVINGAKRIRVTFVDGSESDAVVVNTQPENDLAVLRAKTIPDDLEAATMRSTDDLSPGDEVIAVGFPFGIGPSVSQGVVSGLKRQFRSPDGQQMLTNLIQFDAAANPGNSGGPLVTMDGAVVGIVTAILNPNRQRVFIGIGFAVPIENAAAGAGMPPF